MNFDTGVVLTVSGNSANAPEIASIPDALDDVNPNNLSVLLNCTAASGTTPSLTVEVQWSHDGTNFASAATPDTFTAITVAGKVVKSFQVKGRFARLAYVITGTTPSFTLTASGYAA
jgi:hypothetical protein